MSGRYPMASIEVLKEEARATEPKPKPKAKALPPGVPWSKSTDEMGSYGMSRLVASAMHQVYLRRSAGPDQLMIEEGQEGAFWPCRMSSREAAWCSHMCKSWRSALRQKRSP